MIATRWARWQLALVVALQVAACRSPEVQERRVDHGRLYEQAGVRILELTGSPQERGKAAGLLVGEQIRWALPRYLEATIRTDKPTGHPLEIVRKLESSIPRRYLEEIDALAEAAQVDRDTLLLVNLAPEAWAGLACSCMAATAGKSATGSPLLARNLDWYGGDVLKDLGLLTVVRGDGNAFAALSYPGLVGVVTGMNAHALSVANLVVLGQQATPAPGVPVLFAVREILEQEATLEGAVEHLRSMQRTVPQNYAGADRAGAAVLETWRQRFRRRDPIGGFVAVGNLFDEDQKTHPNGRYPRMMKVGEASHLDVAALKAALLEVALGDMNVHSAIFDPAAGVIYGSSQSRPAAQGPYWRVDARSLLASPARAEK